MDREPFFIVGPSRSGTTLLERLLRHHSRIFVAPETEFLFLLHRRRLLSRRYRPDRMRRFLRFYLTRRPPRLLGLHEVDGLEEHLLAGADSYREVFCNLLELLGDGDGKPLYGEKTPHHLHCIDYIMEAFPQSRIIATIRDGRAVVRSRLEHPRWERNLLGASRRWDADARKLHEVLTLQNEERLLLVCYERLVSEPERVLHEVCTFLGETFEPAMLYPRSVPPRFEAYYDQPWMNKSLSSIDPSRAHSWKEAYTPSALAVVERELGAGLRLFGYPGMADKDVPWRGLWVREWLRHQQYRAGRRIARARYGLWDSPFDGDDASG